MFYPALFYLSVARSTPHFAADIVPSLAFCLNYVLCLVERMVAAHHSIKTASRMTGLLAHLIRIWENVTVQLFLNAPPRIAGFIRMTRSGA